MYQCSGQTSQKKWSYLRLETCTYVNYSHICYILHVPVVHPHQKGCLVPLSQCHYSSKAIIKASSSVTNVSSSRLVNDSERRRYRDRVGCSLEHDQPYVHVRCVWHSAAQDQELGGWGRRAAFLGGSKGTLIFFLLTTALSSSGSQWSWTLVRGRNTPWTVSKSQGIHTIDSHSHPRPI